MNTTNIESRDSLSNTTYHNFCWGGQKFWWIKNEEGEFVDLSSPELKVSGTLVGNRYRGDRHISISGLKPGTYILGCGPKGNRGIREKHTVTAA